MVEVWFIKGLGFNCGGIEYIFFLGIIFVLFMVIYSYFFGFVFYIWFLGVYYMVCKR